MTKRRKARTERVKMYWNFSSKQFLFIPPSRDLHEGVNVIITEVLKPKRRKAGGGK